MVGVLRSETASALRALAAGMEAVDLTVHNAILPALEMGIIVQKGVSSDLGRGKARDGADDDVIEEGNEEATRTTY